MPSSLLEIVASAISVLCLHANAIPHPVLFETIEIDGVSREFYVQIPHTRWKPKAGWPVVFSLHGHKGTAENQASIDDLRKIAKDVAIIIHPEGYPKGRQSWNGAGTSGANFGNGEDGPTCSGDTYSTECTKSCERKGYCPGDDKCRYAHCEDDVKFILAILDHVQKDEHVTIDGSQIFATGHSNGAQMLFELASDNRSAAVFSAVAPICGLPHNGFNRGNPAGRTRLMLILGSRDTYVNAWADVKQTGDPTKSIGSGWYYSEWHNTTNLWAIQRNASTYNHSEVGAKMKGLGSYDKAFACSGWGPDRIATRAEIATCFYQGDHGGFPKGSYQFVWDFFQESRKSGGPPPYQTTSPPPPPSVPRDACARTASCGGYNCDEWIKWDKWYTCNQLESHWGCDCWGCSCMQPGKKIIPEAPRKRSVHPHDEEL